MSEGVFEESVTKTVENSTGGVINVLFSRDKHPEAVKNISLLQVLYIEKGKSDTAPTMKTIMMDALDFYRKALERGIEIE